MIRQLGYAVKSLCSAVVISIVTPLCQSLRVCETMLRWRERLDCQYTSAVGALYF